MIPAQKEERKVTRSFKACIKNVYNYDKITMRCHLRNFYLSRIFWSVRFLTICFEYGILKHLYKSHSISEDLCIPLDTILLYHVPKTCQFTNFHMKMKKKQEDLTLSSSAELPQRNVLYCLPICSPEARSGT